MLEPRDHTAFNQRSTDAGSVGASDTHLESVSVRKGEPCVLEFHLEARLGPFAVLLTQ